MGLTETALYVALATNIILVIANIAIAYITYRNNKRAKNRDTKTETEEFALLCQTVENLVNKIDNLEDYAILCKVVEGQGEDIELLKKDIKMVHGNDKKIAVLQTELKNMTKTIENIHGLVKTILGKIKD